MGELGFLSDIYKGLLALTLYISDVHVDVYLKKGFHESCPGLLSPSLSLRDGNS